MFIGDNGIGIESSKFKASKNTLGMMLIKNLIRQINGQVELVDTKIGTYFNIKFEEV